MITFMKMLMILIASISLSATSFAKDENDTRSLWNEITIHKCPTSFDVEPAYYPKAAKEDERLKEILSSNPNRKMIISKVLSARLEGKVNPNYYTIVSTLGSLQKAQGRINQLSFLQLVNEYKKNWVNWKIEKGSKLYSYMENMLSHLPKEVTETVDYGSLKNQSYMTSADRLVVIGKQQKTKIFDEYLSGWSVMQMSYIPGCIVYMSSFFSDEIYDEKDVNTFAFETVLKPSK